MAAFVEHRQEDASLAENKDTENGDDLSLFVDFTGDYLNLDLLQKPNQIQVSLDSEPENTLTPGTKSIMQAQDPGADNILNSENNNIVDYDWVVSPSGNHVSSMQMYERTTVKAKSTRKLPTLSSNGVKSSTGSIKKAPSTAKPLRSSTPTSRAAITAPTKPLAPIKRSTTPTPRPSIPPAARSASRSSTPTQRPSIAAPAKSASRSSTPTQRPSVASAAKSGSRSATPTHWPAITATARSSASRSSTPTARTSNPSVNGSRSSSAMKLRGGSTVKSRPSKNPPEMTVRSVTVTETNLKAVPKRTSCSPSRRHVSNGGGNNSLKSGIKRDDDDDVNPVLMGTKMVERVVNMRKLAPPKQDISNQNNTSGKLLVSQENSGFGRSLSKKSFDMALRHLDIRRSMPGNMRAMVTKLPARPEPESSKR